MPRIICAKCGLDFRVKSIGVPVLDVAYDPPDLQKLQYGDMLECPGCGVTIIAGFSGSCYDAQQIQNAVDKRNAVYVFESLNMKAKFLAKSDMP